MAKVKMTKTIIERFKVCGKVYKIMQDEKGSFWGIEDKDPKKAIVNGFEGVLSRTLNATLRRCYIKARMEELMQGRKYKDIVLRDVAIIASDETIKIFGADFEVK